MKRIAIVGGGIGGLTAASLLASEGFQVDVYEQASRIAPVGAGLGLFPNAMRVLTKMGLREKIELRAVRQSLEVFRRFDDGRVIRSAREEQLEQDFGSPRFTIHRADLLDALISALPSGALHLGERLQSLTQDKDGVDLQFVSGRRVRADVVLGADGITSTVARLLDIGTRPHSSGYAVNRTVIPRERVAHLDLGPEDATTMWLGPHRHFSHYWVSSGRALNVMATVHSPLDLEEAWTVAADPREVREAYKDWHPQVRGILDAAEGFSLFGLFHRYASERWNVGRVALLGDAAHPMVPFFGQGAAMAMEDAEALRALLTGAPGSDIPRRLDVYSATRFERARRCQNIATDHAREWELPDGPEQRARDARLAGATDGAASEDESGTYFSPSQWLYGYNPAEAVMQALEAKGARQ